MKKNVSITVSSEKLSALEMYLVQKNTTLAAELEKFTEQLYMKHVPQNVRDYIDLMSSQKSDRKENRRTKSETLVPNSDV